MSQAVRVGVIGAGGNTRTRHLPGFQAIPGVSVVAVCNRRRDSAVKVAAEFGIPRVVSDWREIVASAEIDAVCIGTWPNLHAELTVAALASGKHVLTEARMARDLSEAKIMLAAAQQHSAQVAQLVPAPMSLPFDATVNRLLRAGALGTIREVVISATSDALADSAQPLSWRQDFALNGKNTLQLGIYYEIVLRWLGCEVRSVVADAAIFTRERSAGSTGSGTTSIPESITVLGSYADGARLVAHCSGVEATAPRAEIRLNGSQGGIRLDLIRGELWQRGGGGFEQPISIAPADRNEWRVEADFIDSIRNGTPVRLTNFQTGLQYMQFTEAVWESWNAAGRRISLPT